MTNVLPRILPLGEYAVVVEFGFEISDELNGQAIALAEYFDRHPFPGFIETVPAYTSTALFFDPLKVRQSFHDFKDACRTVCRIVEVALQNISASTGSVRDLFEIPVAFGGSSGPDLELVSESSGLSVDAVIELFTSKKYRVYLIGFLPGFAYMGEVDQRLRMPRKVEPRLVVPKGSVGIAGSQTGIYPLESPGGWQILGRTDVELFTPNDVTPSLLQAGDIVKFTVLE
jgi:inhibitor of KinA